MTVTRRVLRLSTALLLLAPAGALANSASELGDLVGARAGQAEGSLEARGFVHIETHKDSDRSYAYYWNQSADDCVKVTTQEGRYTAIDDVGDSDCHKHEGKDVAVAAAAVGAVAILGAILASGDEDDHKSHHHSSGKHSDNNDNEREFELGYRAGLYNTSYHNSGRSDSYSDGYSAGVRDRANKTSPNLRTGGRGGYQSSVYVGDLQNARASSADDSLRDRGFHSVDNFTSGDTRYNIYYNRNTHQCLQATIADGRVLNLNDIQTHPKCH